MATYKLTYFNGRGAAEGIRLTLSAAGQDFEDVRVTQETWPKLKPSAPMKALPMLEVSEKGKTTTYCQSGSCTKYLAKKFGLMGATPEEELLIDEVYESVGDTLRELYKSFFEKDEDKKAELKTKFVDEHLPKLYDYVKLRKGEYGVGGYVIGSKLTLADIVVFGFTNSITMLGNGAWFEKYPELTKHEALVKTNAKIAKWLAKRPESQF